MMMKPTTKEVKLPFGKEAAIEIRWAAGWSPKRVQEILEKDFFRVGFKASSAHFLSSSNYPGKVQKRAVDRTNRAGQPIVYACSSSAVHLAWQPYHFTQSPGQTILGLCVMSDSHPGAVGTGHNSKMYGIEYTIVATADSYDRHSWWRNITRRQGLALFDVNNIVGSRMKNRPWRVWES